MVLTGRLSLRSHPWLADHAVSGTVLFPGTALVELAIHAGDRVGRGHLEELTLETPLVLPDGDGVELQVRATGPDGSGRTAVTVHSRRDAEWVRHATGTLTADRGVAEEDLRAWPPVGATAVDLDGVYESLAARGYEYGPVFRGLRAAWRRGEEVFAEVALPEGESVEAFGVHPALFDAALQATTLESLAGSDEVELPFAFTGVSLFATGAAALRVRVTPDGDGVGLLLADTEGVPVAVIGSLVSRPLPAGGLRAADPGLLRLEWTPVASADDSVPAGDMAFLGDRHLLGALRTDAEAVADLATLRDRVRAGTPARLPGRDAAGRRAGRRRRGPRHHRPGPGAGPGVAGGRGAGGCAVAVPDPWCGGRAAR